MTRVGFYFLKMRCASLSSEKLYIFFIAPDFLVITAVSDTKNEGSGKNAYEKNGVAIYTH
jgi:hypothetical protein